MFSVVLIYPGWLLNTDRCCHRFFFFPLQLLPSLANKTQRFCDHWRKKKKKKTTHIYIDLYSLHFQWNWGTWFYFCKHAQYFKGVMGATIYCARNLASLQGTSSKFQVWKGSPLLLLPNNPGCNKVKKIHVERFREKKSDDKLI